MGDFKWVQKVIARDKQIKCWSATKKRALTMAQKNVLHEPAKCRNHTTYGQLQLKTNTD